MPELGTKVTAIPWTETARDVFFGPHANAWENVPAVIIICVEADM